MGVGEMVKGEKEWEGKMAKIQTELQQERVYKIMTVNWSTAADSLPLHTNASGNMTAISVT